MSTHDTHTQYKLRMPPELRDKLKSASEENHRSMNAEIVARLQDSFEASLGPKEIVRLRRTSDVSALESRDVDLLEEMMAILIERKIDERLGKKLQKKFKDKP
ncbi:Arc family DNA-binding protein [Halomonas sp. C22]|uniref:Arc family DNA-binding protein n=1 Tax=Halomonas sp. C22 TaxID=2580567 RepID=UPI0011A8A8B3|nr:Arc family DNA-binding protein [Halomonas sp. C22]